MPQTSAMSWGLLRLKEKAEKAGFTPEGLHRLFVMLNLNEDTLSVEEMWNLWPYINEINAKKFNYHS